MKGLLAFVVILLAAFDRSVPSLLPSLYKFVLGIGGIIP
jgi:hypothetical protein